MTVHSCYKDRPLKVLQSEKLCLVIETRKTTKRFFPPKRRTTPAKVRRKIWWGESSQFAQPVSGKAWWIWCIVNRIQKMQQGGDRRWNQSRRRSKHEVSKYLLSLQISFKRKEGIFSGHIIREAYKFYCTRCLVLTTTIFTFLSSSTSSYSSWPASFSLPLAPCLL